MFLLFRKKNGGSPPPDTHEDVTSGDGTALTWADETIIEWSST
jgi:hypothetical protein